MPRYADYGPGDEQPEILGDKGFAGVVTARSPQQLPPGIAAWAVNKDFRRESADTRKGFLTVAWAAGFGVDFPIDFPFDWSLKGFRAPRGIATFSDPYSQEGLLVATQTASYRLRQYQEPARIELPSGTRLETPVRLVPCFDRVLMFGGALFTPLEWNPQDQFELGAWAWQSITQTASRVDDPDNTYGDGTRQIPNGLDATLFNSRLYVITGRDEVAVSDVLDYTRYQPMRSAWRIQAGSDDQLMKVLPWLSNASTLVAFKDQSIFMLSNIYGALEEVRSDVLTGAYGLIARDAWVAAGKDIWFLSDGAIRSVQATIDNALQAEQVPMSAPIREIMERVNWAAAKTPTGAVSGGAVAGYTEEKAYWAVPIDGSTRNNALIVFDWVRGQWAGVWTADFLDVIGFAATDYNGRRQLFALNGSEASPGKAAGALLAIGHGYRDEIFEQAYEISDELLTRGYAAQEVGELKGNQVKMLHRTWRPSYSVAALTDGVNEELSLVAGRTKNRLKYYTWGKVNWDPTNVNDDHGLPYREDYAVWMDPGSEWEGVTFGPIYDGALIIDYWGAGRLYYVYDLVHDDAWQVWVCLVEHWTSGSGDATFEDEREEHPTYWQAIDWPVDTDAEALDLGENGVNPNLHQHHEENFRMSRRGQYVQLRFRNTQGRQCIAAVTFEERAGKRGPLTKA